MAQKRKKGTKQKQKQQSTIRKVGLAIFLMSIFSLSSLGFIGRIASSFFRFFTGEFYFPLSILTAGVGLYMIVMKQGISIRNKKMMGLLLMIVGILLLLHARLFAPVANPELRILSATWRFFYADLIHQGTAQTLGGGMVGGLLYTVTYFLFSQAGSYISAVLLISMGAIWIFNFPIRDVIRKIKEVSLTIWERMRKNLAKKSDIRKQEKAKQKEKKQNKKSEKEIAEVIQDSPDISDYSAHGIEINQGEAKKQDTQQTELTIDHFQKQATMNEKNASPQSATEEGNEAPEKELDFDITASTENADYQLPPVSLLDKREASDQSNEYEIIQKNVKKLEETFQSFGVDAKVTKANLGPAVTKYEVQPATGVKVSKIVGLTDDIALALAAKDIRMEAPIPGKALIGIEVPNMEVSMVTFRDVIEGQKRHPDSVLEVPIGRDISGSVTMADLSKMPHMLVAGATGSGKSVCINGIITSLLMKAKPNEVKLMMIDPKMVELNVYNGIPHLLTPVVTNPKKAAQALQKVVQEMERRYELFAASGARNITGYNDQVKEHNRTTGEAMLFLPFIVVIVDELADLMMVASNEVEDAIIRLAQMARAAGIHMILATQRPSVDVITGIIKANVPSRIAFAVSSGTDSRTILDGNGAEKLLGRGDMLFQPMGQNKPTRVQGAFISDEEVEAIVAFVKTQQEPNYVEEMMPKEEPVASTEEAEDELFDEAVDLIVDMQTASISLLQRRFRVGYNRAARMIDEMEMRGIVGPSEGSKPRVVNLQKNEEQIED